MSGLRRQGAWAVADQVLSSGTNFVPALLLARLLGPAGYGAFSLAFVAWFAALQLLRGALMQPYTLTAASLEGSEWREVTAHASGAILVGGVVVGFAFAVAAVVVGASTGVGHALAAVAILAPGLALQEFWRVASFAARRARTAAANDALWALGQILAFTFVLAHGNATAADCLLAWGAGGWLAAGIGALQLSVVPQLSLASARRARQWLRVGAWFTAESTIFSLGTLIVAVIVAAEIGKSGLGLFRTVQNLFGPVQLLTIGAESVFLPHLVRAINGSAPTGAREGRLYSLVMASTVAAYGLIVLVAAHVLLKDVFGTAFAAATVLVVPVLIAFTLDAITSGAEILLRARAQGGRLLVAQLTSTTARVAAVSVLVRIDGLRGAGWGLVIGSSVAAILFWAEVLFVTAHDRGRDDAVPLELSSVLLLAETDRLES